MRDSKSYLLSSPLPISKGYVFILVVVDLFVGLLATLSENGWAKFHQIFRIGQIWNNE